MFPMLTKDQIIEQFKLEPLTGEGGYFQRNYESDDKTSEGRRLCASIYYFLEAPDFSCFHQLDCDELWHFYLGEVMLVHVIDKAGMLVTHRLGNPLVHQGAMPFLVVKRGAWFAAEVAGGEGMSLVGCTTTPEFRFEGFVVEKAGELIKKFPGHAELIGRLTRA
jgi:predicted cupin superfamily sugar epimerase